jgi:signal transduction histidine kinase
MKQISAALHDLCQPLTTLQCGLEMAGLIGTAAAYREAVETGVGECARLSATVASMRQILRAAAALDEEIGAVP